MKELQWNDMQACTEMIMPQGGSKNDSIFPEYKWKYEYRVDYCSAVYGVEPRPNWITTEFGGPVRTFSSINSNLNLISNTCPMTLCVVLCADAGH